MAHLVMSGLGFRDKGRKAVKGMENASRCVSATYRSSS